MNTILLNIKMLYNKMGKSEKKIADYVLQYPTEIWPLSTSELAEKSGSSDATIVRFSRRLGYDGYQQLKLALARECDSINITENISPSDPPLKVFEKICNDIYCSLEKTRSVFDSDSFTAICQKILSSKRILIFGLGNSAAVAADMAHKLLRLGFDATSYSDNHMQVIAASHLDKDCIAIGISHSGSSTDIIDALKIAKRANALTASITNSSKSPIYTVSDYVLKTVSDETNYRILGLNSRIAQLAIIDAIYYFVASHMQQAKEMTELTEDALHNKKF